MLYCELCNFSTNNPANFKQHQLHRHGVHIQKRPHFDYRLHALDGMPQCSQCKRVYATWKGLQFHDEMGCQEMPAPSKIPAATAAAEHVVTMTDSDLLYLRSTSWGKRLLDIVLREAWGTAKQMKRSFMPCAIIAFCVEHGWAESMS